MGKYIDLDFVKEYTRTNFDETTVPSADIVEEFINISEQEIDEKSGKSWGLTTHTSELYDNPRRELLLKNYPVVSVDKISTINPDADLIEGIDADYIVDGDFIVFNKNKPVPTRVYVTYDAGYEEVRGAAKMLATLLTIKKIKQSASYKSNANNVRIGVISLTRNMGAQNMLNLDKDVDFYWKQLRRLVR
jgi:hypothetical protein